MTDRFPNLHVLDHPLILHKLSHMRDRTTSTRTFRQLLKEISLLMGYEITRDFPMTTERIETPLASMDAPVLAGKKLAIVPILRAGLGMLDGMTRLLPTAEVGFLGMIRDEETLKATTYATRLPDDLTGRQVYLLDPMLATGGTLAAATRYVVDRGADHITAICLLAAPEGVELLERETADLDVPLTVVTAALDERLNEKGYIVPGLGDAGDRLYGIVD